GAFLAKEILRSQRAQLLKICGEASLHSSQSGETRAVRASGGLDMEQLSPLCDRTGRTGGDRVGMGCSKTGSRARCCSAISPLKPKAGLSGPPDRQTNIEV